MNIGEAVKQIQKIYPSVSISRIRFLEKEGLINLNRTKGGTRVFSNKDIARITKILELQETKYFSLKAIKSNPQLLTNKENSALKITEHSHHNMLKQTGLSDVEFSELVNYEFEIKKEKYDSYDLDRLKSWSYFFKLGLEPKHFSVLKSISERTSDFVELSTTLLDETDIDEKDFILNNFTNLIRSYSLKNLS
jgi:DNA-binding transcriptional MerR regulator